MGAGSAPPVNLPDVSLVFGLSLLFGYILMLLKPGADFGENLVMNLALLLLASAMIAHGVYYGLLLQSHAPAREEDDAEEAIDAELV